MIPLFSPSTNHAEIAAIIRTLDSRWIGKGQRVAEFEAAWAAHVNVPAENMVSTNSCTSALFEAVRLAGIGKGDEVIIPTIHFVGCAQAVIAVGGTPVFCDVDKWSMNATYETIKEKLTTKTKAVIMNHYGGNMARIIDVGDLRGLIWIDDLACAPMVKITELSSDFATWSTDSMKVITTGDGGFLYCKNVDHAAQARQDFCLGVNSESGMSSKVADRWWAFAVERQGERRELMNDIAASIGLCQLAKLDGFIERRKEIVWKYVHELVDLDADLDTGIRLYPRCKEAYSFFWLFTARRDELARFLRVNNIYTSFRYHPLHLAYNTGDSLPNAEWAADHALLLPLNNNLSDSDVEFICDKVKSFYG